MKNEDTVKLLKECNAGCKNATNTMEQVLPYLKKGDLRRIIEEYNEEHAVLGKECHKLLNEMHESEKDPHPMVRAMAHTETTMRLSFDGKPEQVAKIMHKGCFMGIESLSRYLNQYENADEESRCIAEDLIRIEENFEKDLRRFL